MAIEKVKLEQGKSKLFFIYLKLFAQATNNQCVGITGLTFFGVSPSC